MKRMMIFSILLLIPAMLLIALWAARPAAGAPADKEITGLGAAWYNPDWHYRRPVTVTNTTTTLTNYQVLISLDSSFDFGHARTDGADLRVTANDGTTLLPFWVENWDSVGLKAWVWVKVPSLPNGSTVIYLYFGNASAASASNGSATFEAYDGFENYNVGAAPTGNYINPGEWARYASNPVLPLGGTGTWDVTGATFASVVYDSAATPPYRMYYHGWGTVTPCTGSCIGLATSPDGRTWTKYASNPILTPGGTGAWDANGVRVPMVWKEGPGDYRMIYSGSGSVGTQVGYATSTDGISWTKYGSNPVFNDPNGWGAHNSTQNWGVIKVGSDYLMWYQNATAPRQSNIATSTNLTTWSPYSNTPIFATNNTPSDDRYSQFSLYTFVYGGFYYVLVPSYSSVGDYASYYLYRSSSPYFPTSDRHLVRVAHTVGNGGAWDSVDSDTPAVLTSDIQRTTFPNNQLLTYYAGVNSTTWREGLLVETNIDTALADAALPSGTLRWTPDSGVIVVNNPVRQGLKSVQIPKPSTGGNKSLKGVFPSLNQGVVGAWMRRDNTTAGDFDIYLYENSTTLAAVAGLGRNGDFHYWNGSYQETSALWSTNTWYLVTLVFNTNTDHYDFVVYDQSLAVIIRVNNIAFGNPVGVINTAWFYESSAFVGNGYGDDFRLRKYVSTEPTVSMRSTSDIQQTQAIAGPGTIDFSLVGITVTVTTQGSLTSLQVIRYPYSHPYGTYYLTKDGVVEGTKTGRYWEINPDNTGYTVNLTLPHNSTPDDKDKVCRWTGTGRIWDCAAAGYDAGKGIIWRNGITQLSEWATGNDVDPTAVKLIGLTAISPHGMFLQTTLITALVIIVVAVGLFWRYRWMRIRH